MDAPRGIPAMEKFDELMNGLDARQRQAVTHKGGPLAVIAGPGTGKTRVLTMRVCYLVCFRGVDPSRVLAITFTNQAAGEIRERLRSLLPRDTSPPRVTTFHQWALDFLKGLPGREDFNPVDEAGARDLLRQAASRTNMDPRAFYRMAEEISLARQHWPLSALEEDAERVLDEYVSLLRKYHLWDYDDLILEAAEVLTGDKDLRDQVRGSLPHVLVDEFQDVSPAQYRLVRCLAQAASEITVIGDPDQAIYGFRGASPEFLREFQRDFHPVTTLRLKSCYRCPQVVLDAAQGVLNRDKGLESRVGQGKKIVFRSFRHPSAEAGWVADTIEKTAGGLSFDAINFGRAGMDETMPLDSIAVLFRARVLGNEVSDALARRGIPFQRADRRDPLAELGLLPAHHLLEAARDRNRDYHLGRLSRLLDKAKHERIWFFLQRVSGLNGADLLEETATFLGLERDSAQMMILKRFASEAGEAASLALFCRNEADLLDIKVEAVRLMSLHAAKGLEFPVVFLIGCDQGILPWEGVPVDEEQRLFYVGLTRAARRLYLSASGRKSLLGRRLAGGFSPFLRAIPSHLLEEKEQKASKYRKPNKPRQRSLF